MALTKQAIIASIRGQLLQSNYDTLLNNLGDASVQIQEKNAKIEELEAKVKELQAAMDKAPPIPIEPASTQ